MDRRRTSLEDSRTLRETSLHTTRALQRRHDEVSREEERTLRRTDREIESLRRELDELMREKAMASSVATDIQSSCDSEFGADAYTTPVVHEARQRIRNIREKVAKAEQELRRATEAAEGHGACGGGAPRLIVDEVMPGRARRSMSVPNVPAQLERFNVDRMPIGPGASGFGYGGLLSGPTNLQVPGGGQPLRKRSIDFSQLSSLGVIRESD